MNVDDAEGRTPALGVVELSAPGTWPLALQRLVATQPAWNGSDCASDLETSALAGDLMESLQGWLVRAFHATRLLDHEVDTIRTSGLRRLTPELINDKLRAATRSGHLTSEQESRYREAHWARPDHHRAAERLNQVCLVAGRTWLDRAHRDCRSMLEHWGGEALDFPHDGQPLDTRQLGKPAIVVVDVLLTTEDLRYGYEEDWLLKACLATRFGLDPTERCAQVNYRTRDIPGCDVIDIWQPGESEYDEHAMLPAT